jgi:hypothetical protein
MITHLARYISTDSVEIVEYPQDYDYLKRLVDDGFMEFVCSDIPNVNEYEKTVVSYMCDGEKVYQIWNVVVDSFYYVSQINKLKQQLESSDYKIMKCYELSMIGEPMPYDVFQMHTERQDLRDEINRISDLLKSDL